MASALVRRQTDQPRGRDFSICGKKVRVSKNIYSRTLSPQDRPLSAPLAQLKSPLGGTRCPALLDVHGDPWGSGTRVSARKEWWALHFNIVFLFLVDRWLSRVVANPSLRSFHVFRRRVTSTENDHLEITDVLYDTTMVPCGYHLSSSGLTFSQ